MAPYAYDFWIWMPGGGWDFVASVAANDEYRDAILLGLLEQSESIHGRQGFVAVWSRFPTAKHPEGQHWGGMFTGGSSDGIVTVESPIYNGTFRYTGFTFDFWAWSGGGWDFVGSVVSVPNEVYRNAVLDGLLQAHERNHREQGYCAIWSRTPGDGSAGAHWYGTFQGGLNGYERL